MSDWKSVTCDLETNGLVLESTKIWCIACCDNETGEVRMFSDEQFDASVIHPIKVEPISVGIRLMEQAEQLCFHYGLGFDKLVLEKFYPNIKLPKIIDTLTLSRLHDPELGKGLNFKSSHGGHSVEAWTRRLKLETEKVPYDDWVTFDPLIIKRCHNDVIIQREIFLYLRNWFKKSEFKYGPAINLELAVQEVAGVQEMKGWKLNVDTLSTLTEELATKLAEYEEKIYSTLPLRTVKGLEAKQIFLKNGQYANTINNYFGDLLGDKYTVNGVFTKVSFPSINLSSSTQVKTYLLTQGWRPDLWNLKKDKNNRYIKDADGKYIKTSPKITLTSLESLTGFHGELFKLWLQTKHRYKMLLLFKDNLRPDGRISARVNTIGCQTFRMSHKTVANIPRVGSFMGEEFRSLFIVDGGYSLLGIDQSSLEARIFASLLGDPTVIYEICNGDIHTRNAELMGVDRNTSKSLLYALLYGAGNGKLGELAGIPGEEVKRKMEEAFPGLDALRKKFTEKGRRGYLTAIDGRRLSVRDDYKSMNSWIQSAGGIVVKWSYADIWRQIKHYKLDAFPVGCFHDEIQFQCNNKDIDKLKEICYSSFKNAGKHFKLKCPLDSEIKIGAAWNECH